MSIIKLNATKMTVYIAVCIHNSLIYIYKTESPNSENREYGNILLAVLLLRIMLMHVDHIYHQNTSSLSNIFIHMVMN